MEIAIIIIIIIIVESYVSETMNILSQTKANI